MYIFIPNVYTAVLQAAECLITRQRSTASLGSKLNKIWHLKFGSPFQDCLCIWDG